MDFPIQEATIKAINEPENWGSGWVKLYETLAKDFMYPAPEDLVVFPDNHDMMRIYSQVGEDYDNFKLANTYFATTRGVPQYYYGTEILMSSDGDHRDLHRVDRRQRQMCIRDRGFI